MPDQRASTQGLYMSQHSQVQAHGQLILPKTYSGFHIIPSKQKKNTHVYIITSSKIKPAILTSLSFKVFHNLTLIYHPSLIYYLSIRILHSHISSAIQRPWLTFILKLWWTSFIVSSLAKHQENSVRF